MVCRTPSGFAVLCDRVLPASARRIASQSHFLPRALSLFPDAGHTKVLLWGEEGEKGRRMGRGIGGSTDGLERTTTRYCGELSVARARTIIFDVMESTVSPF